MSTMICAAAFAVSASLNCLPNRENAARRTRQRALGDVAGHCHIRREAWRNQARKPCLVRPGRHFRHFFAQIKFNLVGQLVRACFQDFGLEASALLQLN